MENIKDIIYLINTSHEEKRFVIFTVIDKNKIKEEEHIINNQILKDSIKEIDIENILHYKIKDIFPNRFYYTILKLKCQVYGFIIGINFILHPIPEISNYHIYLCKNLDILINVMIKITNDKNILNDLCENFHCYILPTLENPYPLEMLSSIQLYIDDDKKIPVKIKERIKFFQMIYLIIQNYKKNKKDAHWLN